MSTIPQQLKTQQQNNLAQVQQLLVQRSNFEAAHQTNTINDQQYKQAMDFNQQQLSGLGYNVQPTYTAAPRPSQTFVGPMPADTSRIAGFQATSKPFVGPVKPTTTNQPTALETAKQQADIEANFRLGANTRQGTSPTGMSYGQITQNLTPEDKKAFTQWQNQKPITAMVDLGLFLGSA